MLIDLSITAAHSESATSVLYMRNQNLLLDISNVYLCSDVAKLANITSGTVKLKGVTLYVENKTITAIGFRGEPYSRLKCIR
jgi:hypothetical protein